MKTSKKTENKINKLSGKCNILQKFIDSPFWPNKFLITFTVCGLVCGLGSILLNLYLVLIFGGLAILHAILFLIIAIYGFVLYIRGDLKIEEEETTYEYF